MGVAFGELLLLPIRELKAMVIAAQIFVWLFGVLAGRGKKGDGQFGSGDV
jgi:hypothetical protein